MIRLTVISFLMCLGVVGFCQGVRADIPPGHLHSPVRAEPTPTPAIANIAVKLSKATITLSCTPGMRSPDSCNDDSTVEVQTQTTQNLADRLTFTYTVSGGRIVGQGHKVTWDLSGVRPGTYTVTVGAEGAAGMEGETVTKTVVIQNCPDCRPATMCPALSLSGPSGLVRAGQPMTFTADISGNVEVTFNWSVSAGTISSGQGTSSITVDTAGLANQNVTATVDLSGANISFGCSHNASTTASVAPLPTGSLFSANIGGRVVDARGRGVPNALVQLLFGSELARTTSDARGNYTFAGVAGPETYTVQASKDGKSGSQSVVHRVAGSTVPAIHLGSH